LASRYNCIPVHAPGNATKFIGVLLVKELIINAFEGAATIRELNLAHLPVIAPELSCLDILNFFRGRKSHVVLVTECGTSKGQAIGILTLEDITQKLIGE
jgi:metal transporter CNNM